MGGFLIYTPPCIQKFQNGFYPSALKIPLTLERLRFMFTPNSRSELVPCDQVFPLFSLYSLLLLQKLSSFLLVLTTGTVGDCFYLLIFYSEKFSTWDWRLLFAVNTNLNLSINSPLPFPFSIFSTSPSDSTDATYINFTLPQTGTEHKWTCAHSENITIKRIEYIWAFGVSSCS